MSAGLPDAIRPLQVPFRRIAEQAEEMIRNYFLMVGVDKAALGISFDHVYEQYIYPVYGIRLIEDHDLELADDGEKVLGMFDPESNTAYIDVSLHPSNEDPRRAFTCWHEVCGHGVLQGDWIRSEFQRLRHRPRIITTEASIRFIAPALFERQANIFAARAAAPDWLLYFAMKTVFDWNRPFRYIGPGEYTFCPFNKTQVRVIADFDHFCRVVASYIRDRWFHGLSIEALSYRLRESPYFRDESHGRFGLHRTARRRERTLVGV